jgi:hypothetical protein
MKWPEGERLDFGRVIAELEGMSVESPTGVAQYH